MAEINETTPYDDVFRTEVIECQSTPDNSLAVRMYEYDTQLALKDKEWNGDTLTVRFPN